MRIRIAKDRGVSYKGEHLEGGQEYEIDDLFGSITVSEGRAEEVDGDAREERPTHRDAGVRRGTR